MWAGGILLLLLLGSCVGVLLRAGVNLVFGGAVLRVAVYTIHEFHETITYFFLRCSYHTTI
jgi:hypothetical protein